ncbi:MAG TPA: succinylglutamate desuccinylase/aspartoacylase family protein [Planctomycetota bacterium]|nr:succinylglutamate desuccinylase/aspartoacylase family protein [Planctomycetota bacterium]
MVDTKRRDNPHVATPFELGGITVIPGERSDIRVKISELYTAVPVTVPLTVVNGAAPGPRLFVTAAIHGNEINGIEIVRRIRAEVDPQILRGTLLLVAIANPIAFMNLSRDLPDGRDLNRFFPGRDLGSMASHIAAALFDKVIRRADYGIDLHTAAAGRTNLPHVRADMKFPQVRRLAAAFGCEVVFDIAGEKGMLRNAATRLGIPTIVYEAGEPLKFQLGPIEQGVTGVKNVMNELGMYEFPRVSPHFQVNVDDHKWIRAEKGGIMMLQIKPGDLVDKGDVIAINTKPFGAEVMRLKAPHAGLVVGISTMPMVIPGSAVCHLVKLGSRLRPLRAMLKKKPLRFE